MTDSIVNYLILEDIIIDVNNRQIVRNNQILPLTAKYFDVLVYFLRNTNRLIPKDEIFMNIWGDTYVTDTALSQCIKDIRKKLDDDAKNPIYLKTIPKHGYLFLKEPEISSSIEKNDNAERSGINKRPYKF